MDTNKLKIGDKLVYKPECDDIMSHWLTYGETYTIQEFYDGRYGVVIINDRNQRDQICMSNVKKYFVLATLEDDAVSHPSHYTWLKEKCGIEVIDITRHLDFDLGNSIKYILRAGRKPLKSEDKSDFHAGTIQDLKKAIWYLNDKIKMLEKNEG